MSDGPPTVLVATGNRHKQLELQRLIGPGFRAIGFPDASPPASAWARRPEDVEESGASFLANARLKAVHASRHQDRPVLADDSGLVVDALGGRPGVRSARHGGPGLTDRERWELVLAEMAEVPSAERAARYVAAVVLARRGQVLAEGIGIVEGRILEDPRGAGGFGYDPIFLVTELARSMAELTPREKDSVSHRARALAEVLRQVPDLGC
jgi:XTP/dITP diphosphohydrolase